MTTEDGIALHTESYGHGAPLIFVHEFGGSYWSWEPQISHFSRRFQCVTFAARGYPPSDIPKQTEQYSQNRAADDIIAVMDGLGIKQAHLAGLSMGGFACLHAGLRHTERVLSITAAGTGYGAEKRFEDYFREVSAAVARNFEQRGTKDFAPTYAEGASRVQFQEKDPYGWRVFAERLAQHDDTGAANTMRGIQMMRPSLYDLRERLAALDLPVLVMTGDEDDHCLQPALFLKQTLPRCGLAVLPKSGHTLNLEEPALFNRLLEDFLFSTIAGRWDKRDPRADPDQVMRTK
ncbi:alpha/beta fold hydrolase [Methyloligella sp. GL2]|nr:alpha/beta fold hydrolase [Methyloligella sp. GL2]